MPYDLLQGSIGVARSTDAGLRWEHLGTALEEPWHLSYPFVYSWNGSVYMVPESSSQGVLNLYRATDFPLHWKLVKVLCPAASCGSAEKQVLWTGRGCREEAVALHANVPMFISYRLLLLDIYSTSIPHGG